VLEKVGAPKIRAALAQPVTRVQQAIITMVLGLMTADVRHSRFLLDKVYHHLQAIIGLIWTITFGVH